MSTELACTACGTELPPKSKFCNECGAPVTAHDAHAEYKQVTVLFADVVHSMDIAAAVVCSAFVRGKFVVAQRRGVRRVAALFECGAGRSQLLPTAK